MATPWEEDADWDRTFGLNYTDDSYRSQHNYYQPNSEWYGGPRRPVPYDISERPAYSEQQAWILYNEVNVTRIRDKPPEDEEPSMEQLQAEENDDFTADACAALEPTNSEGDEKKKKRRRRRKKKKKDNQEESEPHLTDGIQIQEHKSDALPDIIDGMHIQEHESNERIPKLPNITDGIEIQEHDSDGRMSKLPETDEEKGDDDKPSLFGGDSREVTGDTCNEMERVMPKVDNNDNDDNDDMDTVSMDEASDENTGKATKKKKKRRKKKRKLHWTTGNVLDTLLGRNGYAHHSNNFDVKAEPECFTDEERREMGQKWQKELAYLELHKFDMAQFK